MTLPVDGGRGGACVALPQFVVAASCESLSLTWSGVCVYLVT